MSDPIARTPAVPIADTCADDNPPNWSDVNATNCAELNALIWLDTKAPI